MDNEPNTRPGHDPGGQEPTGAGGRADYGPSVGMSNVRQPSYGQGIVVSLLVTAALFVLAIIAIGDPEGTGPPLVRTTGGIYWALAILVVIGAGFGAQYAERTAAQAAAAVGQSRPITTMATAWTVPVVATIAAILLVATYHSRSMLILGPAVAFLGTAGALFSRDLLDDAADTTQRTATTIHTLVVHVVAFLALSSIYLNKLTSWISAPLVGIIAALLILETLERGAIGPERRVAYAVLGGIVLAQATIALNWWPTHGWTGGAVLLVLFYLAAGVLLARAQRSTARSRDVVEFGLVSFVALIILAITA